MHLTPREQEKLLRAMTEIKVLKDRLEHENAYLKDAARTRPSQGIVGKSPRFLSVLDDIEQVATGQRIEQRVGDRANARAPGVHRALVERLRH